MTISADSGYPDKVCSGRKRAPAGEITDNGNADTCVTRVAAKNMEFYFEDKVHHFRIADVLDTVVASGLTAPASRRTEINRGPKRRCRILAQRWDS